MWADPYNAFHPRMPSGWNMKQTLKPTWKSSARNTCRCWISRIKFGHPCWEIFPYFRPANHCSILLTHLCRLSCCSASVGVEQSQWGTRSMPTTCTTRPSTWSSSSWSSPPPRMPRKIRTWGERRQTHVFSPRLKCKTDFRLVVMSLRAQSLLNLRLYKMKRHELKDYQRTIQDVLAKSGEEEVWRNWILGLFYKFAWL